MSFQLWLSFIIVTLLVDLTPGPSVMLVVSVTIGKGVRQGYKAFAGLEAGSWLWFSVALGMMLGAYKISENFLKVFALAGAFYLFYAGTRSFFPIPDFFARLDFRKKYLTEHSGAKQPDVFMVGFMTQLANPKCALYWLAILPQFQLPQGPTLLHNFVLMMLSGLSFLLTISGYIQLAHASRRLFLNEKYQKILDRTSGTVLIALGVWMLLRYFNVV